MPAQKFETNGSNDSNEIRAGIQIFLDGKLAEYRERFGVESETYKALKGTMDRTVNEYLAQRNNESVEHIGVSTAIEILLSRLTQNLTIYFTQKGIPEYVETTDAVTDLAGKIHRRFLDKGNDEGTNAQV